MTQPTPRTIPLEVVSTDSAPAASLQTGAKQLGGDKIGRSPVQFADAPVLRKPSWIRVRIPSGNAVQNGLLTAIVTDDEAATLMRLLGEKPDRPLTVDLEQQTIQCGDQCLRFTIDSVRRTRLLKGWDDIALTKSYMDKIAAFKSADRARRPWARPSPQ